MQWGWAEVGWFVWFVSISHTISDCWEVTQQEEKKQGASAGCRPRQFSASLHQPLLSPSPGNCTAAYSQTGVGKTKFIKSSDKKKSPKHGFLLVTCERGWCRKKFIISLPLVAFCPADICQESLLCVSTAISRYSSHFLNFPPGKMSY